MRRHIHTQQRQQIINQSLLQFELQQQQFLQTNNADPFQTYYYPTPVQDIHQLHQFQQQVQNKLIKLANIEKLDQILHEMYDDEKLIDQKIKALENQNHDIQQIIRLMEGSLRVEQVCQEIKQTKIIGDTVSWSVGCQTEEKKYKEFGTYCEMQEQVEKMKEKKKPNLCVLPIFSMKIKQNTNKAQAKRQINPDLHQKMPINPSKPQPRAQHISHNKYQQKPKIENQSNLILIDTLYNDLQKQMRYLEHLERTKSRNRAAYRQQKKRVKFMIEMFWKSVQQSRMDNIEQFQLPLLEECD